MRVPFDELHFPFDECFFCCNAGLSAIPEYRQIRRENMSVVFNEFHFLFNMRVPFDECSF